MPPDVDLAADEVRVRPSRPPDVHVEPTSGWVPVHLPEIWAYRELLYFLTWRDVKLRYKQTFLGAAWAILQPLLTMVVFSIFFGKLAQIPSDGVPYPIFSYTALLPWTLFAYALSQSSGSMVASAALVNKVYCPRLIIPAASVLSGLVDFALAFIVLLGMMAWYGIVPTWKVVWLPGFLLLTLVVALAVGLWFAALNVRYRDVRYVIPFLTQFWLFATPIAYPISLIKNPTVQTLYGLNPMVSVVEGFRWALLDSPKPSWGLLAVSSTAAVALLVGGVFYFRRMERSFADLI